MVPNSHMDTYACELERSYTETVGNGRMDGPNGVRSYPHEIIFKIYHGLPNILLNLPSRHQHGTGTRVEVLNLVSVPTKFSTNLATAVRVHVGTRVHLQLSFRAVVPS